MSRFQKHQQKQFKTQVISLIVILCLILYFIFTAGIRLLLNASVFIANLTAKKQSSQIQKSEDQYGSIDIDSISTATNSSRISIGGSVINLVSVEFYLNSEKVKEIPLNASDSFSEEIGDLKNGQNSVYVKGKFKDSTNSKRSKEFSVFYKSEKPKLVIKEPSDKSKASKSDIKIKGETDKETFIKINDFPLVVDANGNFETTVHLKDGNNSFIIVAEDIAGNIVTKTIAVTFQKDE